MTLNFPYNLQKQLVTFSSFRCLFILGSNYDVDNRSVLPSFKVRNAISVFPPGSCKFLGDKLSSAFLKLLRNRRPRANEVAKTVGFSLGK